MPSVGGQVPLPTVLQDTATFPLPDGNYIESVRNSCRSCVNSAASPVSVKTDAVKEFLKNLDVDIWKQCSETSTSMALPLKFNTVEEEVTVLGIIDLLNFASGYRAELHAAIGRGAFETMQFGVVAMYITNSKLDSSFMKSLRLADVAQLFGLPISREVQHPDIPVVRTLEPTELRALADSIVRVMNETGLILERDGYRTLGQFVLDVTKGTGCTAANLTEKLVKAFPAFRDAGYVNGQPVYIFKKAQLLCAHLYRRFHTPPLNGDCSRSPSAPFNFPDMASLTVFSDNVLPSMLVHYQVVEVFDETLRQKIQSGLAVLPDEAVALRAAAVVACEEIVRQAGKSNLHPGLKGMTEQELDFYLWKVAKVNELRSTVHRFIFKDTIFF